MFYSKKVDRSKAEYSEMAAIYNETYSSFKQCALQLYSLRKNVIELLEEIETLAKDFTDTDITFTKELLNITIAKETFINVNNTFRHQDTTDLIIGISKAGGPLIKEIAPDIAMWATTFGKASTGTAISELRGIAKINAQKARLGGGAKSVGGRGIAGGEAFLSIIGPIAEISFVAATAIVIPLYSNYTTAKHIDIETKKLRHQAFRLTTAKGNIEKLITNTENAYLSCLNKCKKFQALSNENDSSTTRLEVFKRLVDECTALTALLNQSV